MYNLPDYKESDEQVVKEFIREHPFAFLVACDENNRPVATQVPVFVDEVNNKLVLSGHLMKNTDHHKALVGNPNVLAVFSGPHTYVSASWYENKKQGSTWNYISVHARGTLKFADESSLKKILERTTDHFEEPGSGANFADLPPEYVDRLAKAIVAFEIEVEHLDHVFKLSQNRDEKSYDNITKQLRAKKGDAKLIGDLMDSRKAKVFGQ